MSTEGKTWHIVDFLQDQILSGNLGKDHPIWDHVNKLRPILQMRTVEPTDAPTIAFFDDMIHDPSDDEDDDRDDQEDGTRADG